MPSTKKATALFVSLLRVFLQLQADLLSVPVGNLRSVVVTERKLSCISGDGQPDPCLGDLYKATYLHVRVYKSPPRLLYTPANSKFDSFLQSQA